MSDPLPSQPAESRRRYTWPWFVLGLFILGILLAIAWMSREVQRTRDIRDANQPSPSRSEPQTPKPPDSGRSPTNGMIGAPPGTFG